MFSLSFKLRPRKTAGAENVAALLLGERASEPEIENREISERRPREGHDTDPLGAQLVHDGRQREEPHDQGQKLTDEMKHGAPGQSSPAGQLARGELGSASAVRSRLGYHEE